MTDQQRSDDGAVRARGPVTDAERARVVELHGQGASRGAIARQLGRSPDTVGRIAAAAGLSWDRGRTAVAVAAKQMDNRARRAALISGMYDRALKVLERLAATQYDAVGTATNGETIVTRIGTIPAHDLKQLAGALTLLTNGASRLEAIDDGSDIDHTKSLLGGLFLMLQEKVGEIDAAEDGDR